VTLWRSQNYRASALAAGGEPDVVEHAVRTGQIVQSRTRGAAPVFTLKHLSHLTGVGYAFLRDVVARNGPEPYHLFRIKKRSSDSNGNKRFRTICVPDPRLMKVQRWINAHILTFANPHEASVGFSAGDNIVDAARPHCLCRWLIKLDIVNFFESVSEQDAFHTFNSLGYQRLISFELARLCTRQGKPSPARQSPRWTSRAGRHFTIDAYRNALLGHLPQGAPTSPRLSNLAMRNFDKAVADLAGTNGLTYTRYADDLTLSTRRDDFSRANATAITREIYKVLTYHGFLPNFAKTSIMPPGSRRIALGLLVDGEQPHLTKEFRSRLRKHIYFLTHPDHGPAKHAAKLGFNSVYGLRNHVSGLIAHAAQVDRVFADAAWDNLNRVDWP
jgi:RNA-directed DNA polymerase